MDISSTSGLSPLALGRMLGSAGQALDVTKVTEASATEANRDWFGFEGWSDSSASIGIDAVSSQSPIDASASITSHVLQ